jgi:RNA-binding protein Luc7-like 2
VRLNNTDKNVNPSFQACEHLKSFIDDCDRRTDLAKKRLMETQEELSAEVTSKAEKVHQLAEDIGKKLALAEQVGAEGKVEDSMKLMEEVRMRAQLNNNHRKIPE